MVIGLRWVGRSLGGPELNLDAHHHEILRCNPPPPLRESAPKLGSAIRRMTRWDVQRRHLAVVVLESLPGRRQARAPRTASVAVCRAVDVWRREPVPTDPPTRASAIDTQLGEHRGARQRRCLDRKEIARGDSQQG